jgi:hypothetical protein
MARRYKEGLDYFPINVDFTSDVKVRRVVREHGAPAMAVIIELMSMIYGDHGYYMDWSDDICFSVGDIYGLDSAYVSGVVDTCISHGLFSRAMHDAYGILTSKGIQKRYLDAVKRRADDGMVEEYRLLVPGSTSNMPSVDCIQPRTTSVPNDTTSVPNDTTSVPNDTTSVPSVYKGTQSRVEEIRLDETKAPTGDILLPPSGKKSPAKAATTQAGTVLLEIPLSGGGSHGVTDIDIAHYRELYPAVDVPQEIRGMIGWCEANPARRKTARGVKAFINSWLNKAQNRGGSGYSSRAAPDRAPRGAAAWAAAASLLTQGGGP